MVPPSFSFASPPSQHRHHHLLERPLSSKDAFAPDQTQLNPLVTSFVDSPAHRRSHISRICCFHAQPTPSCGGIGNFPAYVLILLALVGNSAGCLADARSVVAQA